MEKMISFPSIPVRVSACEIKHKPLHDHPHVIELLFVAEGRVGVTMGLRTTFVERGEFLIINAGCLHSVHSSGISTIISLYFSLDHYAEVFPHIHGVRFNTARASLAPEQIPRWLELRNYFIRFMLMYNKNTRHAQTIMRDLADKMIHMLWQWFQNRKPLTKQTLERYYSISTYIQENFQNDITVSKVARHENISATRLAHFWKDTTGKSIRQTITALKLDEAEKLLLTTNMIINDIAYQCGFSDEKYFYQHFKSRYSMTPNEFRLCHLSFQRRAERVLMSRRECEQRVTGFAAKYFQPGITPSIEGQSREELQKEAVLEHLYNAILVNPHTLSRQVESTGQQVSYLNIAPSKALFRQGGEYRINWEYVYAQMHIFIDRGMSSNVIIEYDWMDENRWEPLLTDFVDELTMIWGKKVIESQQYMICSNLVQTYVQCMNLAQFLQERTSVKTANAVFML